jgi:hypothetical protein
MLFLLNPAIQSDPPLPGFQPMQIYFGGKEERESEQRLRQRVTLPAWRSRAPRYAPGWRVARTSLFPATSGQPSSKIWIRNLSVCETAAGETAICRTTMSQTFCSQWYKTVFLLSFEGLYKLRATLHSALRH